MSDRLTCSTLPELPSQAEINVPSLASAAKLVELNVSAWDGVITDDDVSQKVASDNNADSNAGTYRKKLFAGNALLKEIHRLKGAARNHVYYPSTMPFKDRGPRMISNAAYPDFYTEITSVKQQFDVKVEEFLRDYDLFVDQQRGVLGDLFRPHEYPSREAIRNKFSMQIFQTPFTHGEHFADDIYDTALEETRKQYDNHIRENYVNGMNKILGELRGCLENMVEKLTDKTDDYGADGGNNKIFRDTLVPNVLKAVKLVKACNLIGDTRISALCDRLENDLSRVTPEALRDDQFLRAQTKSMTQNVIDNLPSLEI